MKFLSKVAAATIFIAILVLIGAFVSMIRSGLSARDEPTMTEKALARTFRHWAVPAKMRDAKNPLPPTPQLLAEARAHFADHCASCHGNDGKGRSGMGQRMYPKAPDMTLPTTQSLSDGALFAIIENGVRLTGMPAFGDGTPESARSSWSLVHFLRHLPKLTPEELAEMEKLNPKSAEEGRQMEEEEKFLSGPP